MLNLPKKIKGSNYLLWLNDEDGNLETFRYTQNKNQLKINKSTKIRTRVKNIVR